MARKKYDTDFKTKVVLEILKEEKTLSQLASEYGVHATNSGSGGILPWKSGHGPSNQKTNSSPRFAQNYEANIRELYAEVDRLSTQLTWLEKISPRSVEKNDWLWSASRNVSFRSPFRPNLNRSSLYSRSVEPSEEEVRLKHRIDEIHTEHPFHGS